MIRSFEGRTSGKADLGSNQDAGEPAVRASSPRAAATGALRVDLAVIGAGLTGLATALHFARNAPGARIAVLEAHAVADGASGRGTGLLGPRLGPNVLAARSRLGDSQARALHAASLDAVTQALALISEQRLECGLQVGPQYVVARSTRSAKALTRRARAYSALGFDVPLVAGRQLEQQFGIPYRAGLRYEPAATLDPARLARSLARCAEQHGVVIYEGSPVLHVASDSAPLLMLRDGTVRADYVVVATNGYALAQLAQVGLTPMEVRASMSEPLGCETVAQLGWGTASAVIEHGLFAPYFRLTADRRVVLGGGLVSPLSGSAKRRHAQRAAAWSYQEAWLRSLHPALRTARVEERWSGRIAVTRDWLPRCGPLREHARVWHAGGWCGHGLALSLHAGRTLATALLGEAFDAQALPWWQSLPRVRPPRGFVSTLATHTLDVAAHFAPAPLPSQSPRELLAL